MRSSLDQRNSIEAQHGRAQIALTLLRLALGCLFVWVFFENLRKGLYSPSGYSGLINYYIEKGHAPQLLKSVMALMANNAAVAGPMQGLTEITLEETLRGSVFIGSPDTVAGKLKDLQRDIGLSGVQLETNCAGLADHAAEREAIRLLAREVKSAFR